MDRGQAHTLEAFTAALLLVSGLIFALQATAVTPLSASTSNQHIENQQRAVAEDLLAASAETGSLQRAVVHWNTSGNHWNGTPERPRHFIDDAPPNEFGEALEETFRRDQIAYNVQIRWRNANGTLEDPRTLAYMGTPSDNAVVARQTVMLYDDTELTGESRTVSEAADNDEFYVTDDAAPDSILFTVLEVEVVVWRM